MKSRNRTFPGFPLFSGPEWRCTPRLAASAAALLAVAMPLGCGPKLPTEPGQGTDSAAAGGNNMSKNNGSGGLQDENAPTGGTGGQTGVPMPPVPMHPTEPTLVVTTVANPFAASTVAPEALTAPSVVVHPALKYQVMKGFGGSFNEQGWAALLALDEAERAKVMSATFDPQEGLRFNWCRSPIGASDYALERYTLNETDGDYEMQNFSIERDKSHLLPYIKGSPRHSPGSSDLGLRLDAAYVDEDP